jgi:hypothetical protein
MKMTRNKKICESASIALLLLLIASATVTFLPTTNGIITATMETYANLSCEPNPIGVGQYTNVFCIIVPPANPTTDFRFKGFVITITHPDGTNETLYRDAPDLTASVVFTYTPAIVGDYKFQFSFPGQTVNFTQASYYYQPTTSPVVTLHVQQNPIPSYQEAPLPTDYWQRPIYPNNRVWALIGGNWMQSGYNASAAQFNPYSTGPTTSHILWDQPLNIGGLVGGGQETVVGAGQGVTNLNGDVSVEAGFGGRQITCVLMGIAYIVLPDGIHAINESSGQTLWIKPGGLTGASYGTSLQNAGIEPVPVLIQVSGGSATTPGILVKYDLFTGTTLLNTTGYSGTFSDPYVVSKIGNYLVNWTTIGSSANFTSRIMWNTSVPTAPAGSTFGAPGTIWGHYGYSIGRTTPQAPGGIPTQTYCYDLNTGTLVWNETMPFTKDTFTTSGDGKLYCWGYNATFEAYNLQDGSLVWRSDQFPWPFGEYEDYQAGVAYGNLYVGNYAGIIAVNDTTGHINWIFSTHSAGFETAYGNYSFWGGPVIADGKVYASNGEHSPSNPFMRGANLWCVDAFNGTEYWHISQLFGGSSNSRQIADGILFSTNDYDQTLYAFGKGPSSVDVLASPSIVQGTQGASDVLITGHVLDQSPGQTGTPCVSDDSMTGQMEYLHMQAVRPSNITGVPVTISVIDANGNYRPIGTATSDAAGFFSYQWTPDIPGKYTVTASFAGTGAYGSSYAETAFFATSPQPTPTASTTQVQSTAELYFVPAFVGIIVVIIVGFAVLALLVLRKKP